MARRPLERDCALGLDRARSRGHAACCTRRRTNPHGLAARACPPSRVGLAHRLLDTLTERETGGADAAPCRPRGTGARRDSTPASIPARRLASPAVEREQSAAGRPAAAVPSVVIARARAGAGSWAATRAHSRANPFPPPHPPCA